MTRLHKALFGPALLLFVLVLSLPATALPEVHSGERVFDFAGLLDEEEEAQLLQRTREIGESLAFDAVIVITEEMEGLSSREYADDFFDYNGFGVGEERDGALLLINMEESELYISTSGYGIERYNDTAIDNLLDRLVDGYLADGDFYGACNAYLYDVEERIGIRIEGESGRKDGTSGGSGSESDPWTIQINDPSARVYDSARLLSGQEQSRLQEDVVRLADTYRVDIAILTIDDAAGRAGEEYADDFYRNSSLGRGETGDAILLLLDMDAGRIVIRTYGYGEHYYAYHREEYDRLLETMVAATQNEHYYQACADFVETTRSALARYENHVEEDRKYGLAPGEKAGVTGEMVASCLLAGLVVAGGAVGVMIVLHKRSLSPAPSAGAYLRHFAVTGRSDIFQHTKTTRRAIPKHEDSGGGGRSAGGGSASFRSSGGSVHTSSSGRSHGGGGRKF